MTFSFAYTSYSSARSKRARLYIERRYDASLVSRSGPTVRRATVLAIVLAINRYSRVHIAIADDMGRGLRPTMEMLYQLSYYGKLRTDSTRERHGRLSSTDARPRDFSTAYCDNTPLRRHTDFSSDTFRANDTE